MIGVVVWSSEPRQKAVIWCEDQGALAYLQGTDVLQGQMCWPQPGDMLELETETRGALRCATTVRMYREQSCPELPEILMGAADQARPAAHLRVVVNNTAPDADRDAHGLRAACAIGG
ncbi:hypothetical protein [Paracoccus jiaweipingae]|uniref:hypothetical protein n=1 Tax=unclassified Paracoccus (in: a-proteobacteria) TaxID=2688777 RepID=UPI003789659B